MLEICNFLLFVIMLIVIIINIMFYKALPVNLTQIKEDLIRHSHTNTLRLVNKFISLRICFNMLKITHCSSTCHSADCRYTKYSGVLLGSTCKFDPNSGQVLY